MSCLSVWTDASKTNGLFAIGFSGMWALEYSGRMKLLKSCLLNEPKGRYILYLIILYWSHFLVKILSPIDWFNLCQMMNKQSTKIWGLNSEIPKRMKKAGELTGVFLKAH